MTAHASLGASSAHRWMNCPGSVRLSDGIPRTSSPYAEEGTAAHALAEVWLRRGTIDGVTEIKGYPVTDEMRGAVEDFVLYVRSLVGQEAKLYIEQTLTLDRLGPPVPMFGTADAVVYHRNDRALVALDVVDFKYGQGVPVEAVGNVQGLYYVLGALLAHKAIGDEEPELRFTIVQPRAPHRAGSIRTWTIPGAELVQFKLRLLRAVDATLQANAPLNPGDWCRFCPALSRCPAQREHSQALARVDFADMPLDLPPAPEHLPMDVVVDILSKAPILETWLNALRARVLQELEAGHDVPGWKLVLKRPRRVWVSPDELEKWGRSVFGDEFELTMYQRELLSPAQVEKIVGKKNLPPELVVSVSTGTALAPSTDPRPALAAGAQQDFAGLLPPASDDE